MPEGQAAGLKHLWEVDHPYFCLSGSYWVPPNGEAHQAWDDWEEFYAEWGGSNPEIDLVFRWDWVKPEPEFDPDLDDEDEEVEHLMVFIFQQGMARNSSHMINVTEADEPSVRAWLAERAKVIQAIWDPISLGQ